MPRKLCWIEVDEEGKAIGLATDATEEVVEAVADAFYKTGMPMDLGERTVKGNTAASHFAVCEEWARSLLTRLASAPPTPEKP